MLKSGIDIVETCGTIGILQQDSIIFQQILINLKKVWRNDLLQDFDCHKEKA